MATVPTEAWLELRDRLRRFIGSRVTDPHAADDIAQDVLLRLQEHVGDLPPEDKLPAWTIAVARNAVIDHYRARAVRDHADIVGVDAPAETGDAVGDAVRVLSRCLSRMVDQLPEPYREAMRLADFEGLSLQELADRAGVSLSGAKSRVQRARQHMRDMLRNCCDIEQDRRGNVVDFERTERSGRYCGDADGEPQCPG
jgi:RNA polymerase sigma-70 factor (ECF subfamily)